MYFSEIKEKKSLIIKDIVGLNPIFDPKAIQTDL